LEIKFHLPAPPRGGAFLYPASSSTTPPYNDLTAAYSEAQPVNLAGKIIYKIVYKSIFFVQDRI
jgi:hypothetical protein